MRQTNRGIGSMAVSPDGKYLYSMLQDPLANPGKKAYLKARNTRIFKMERASMKPVGKKFSHHRYRLETSAIPGEVTPAV